MSSVIMVSATYTTKIDKAWLYGALSELVSNETMLCTNVFEADSSAPYHRVLEQIDLDKIVFFRPDVKSFQEMNDILIPAVKLDYQDETMPLWRMYVIGKDAKELVWVYDHSIVDGSSGVLFHEKLLKCLNNKDNLNLSKTNNIAKCTNINIAPKFEDAIDIRPSWSFLARYKLNSWKSMLSLDNKAWVGTPVSVPMSSRTECFELEPDLSKKLIKYCRNGQFTLTALLYAVLNKTMAELWVDPSENKYNHFVFTCPVNARRYIKSQPMHDRLGNYVFQYNEDFLLSDRDLPIETLATRFSKSLKEATDQDPPGDMRYNIGLFNYKDLKQYLLFEQEDKTRGDTGEISNLGAFEFEQGEYVGIEKLNFTQGVSSVGAYVTMNVVGVKYGTINGSLSVACDDDKHTRSTQLRDRMIEVIRSLVEKV